jgi:PTS system nitrogen regulatory IIA component
MNELGDLIAPEAILPRLAATSRKQALQAMSEAAARVTGLESRAIFEAVLMRERNKGTGVSNGVAIPHSPVLGIIQPVGVFARLDIPQDFESIDGRACDLVFMLLSSPDKSGDHLKALARVSRLLGRADMRDKLRAARGADDLYALIAEPAHVDAA